MNKQEERTMTKPKNRVNIEVCDNGVKVEIKKGKEILGIKVFEGKPGETYKRYNKWINEVLKK